MGKKKAVSKPTFTIRLAGKGISPTRVSVRQLSEILSAVQTLANQSGETLEDAGDAISDGNEPEFLSLIGVKSGSAVFPIVASRPQIVNDLQRIGEFIRTVEDPTHTWSFRALAPSRQLSQIAGCLKCSISLCRPDNTVLAEFDGETYDRLAKKLLVKGFTKINANIQRVGGVTEMKCAVRLANRKPLLYCSVANDRVSRQLGQSLYHDMVLSGEATWVQGTWEIYRFVIHECVERVDVPLLESIDAIYNAGGRGWESISNVQAALRDLRS